MRLSILPIVQRFQLLFASCNRQSKIYNLRFFRGVLAQLVERLNGIEEVRGSNPLGSSLRSQRGGERRLSRRSLGVGGRISARHKLTASYDATDKRNIDWFSITSWED